MASRRSNLLFAELSAGRSYILEAHNLTQVATVSSKRNYVILNDPFDKLRINSGSEESPCC
jgi:hypothetical protein